MSASMDVVATRNTEELSRETTAEIIANLRKFHFDDITIEEILSFFLFNHSYSISEQILQSIANSTTHPVMNLSWLGLRDNAAKELAKVLGKNTSIRVLILGGNKIRNEGAKALAAALEENYSILQLILSSNHIQNEGAKALTQMLKNRKQFFVCLGLAGNGFDNDHARELMNVIEARHSLVIKSVLEALKSATLSDHTYFVEKFRIQGLRGDALANMLAKDPNTFLDLIPVHYRDTLTAKAPYIHLSECHCISFLSRDSNGNDNNINNCRKIAEDLLVDYYKFLNPVDNSVSDDPFLSLLCEGSQVYTHPGFYMSFRYASIDAGGLFQDLVNIAKLALVGDRGKRLHVDLIDENLYPAHQLVVRNRPVVQLMFEMMAFLYRMGIQVTFSQEKEPLLPEFLAFTLLEKIFPDTYKDPLAVVTLAFYDSIDSYAKVLKDKRVSPNAIVSLDSPNSTDRNMQKLTPYIANQTQWIRVHKVQSANSTAEQDYELQISEQIKLGNWAFRPQIQNPDFNIIFLGIAQYLPVLDVVDICMKYIFKENYKTYSKASTNSNTANNTAATKRPLVFQYNQAEEQRRKMEKVERTFKQPLPTSNPNPFAIQPVLQPSLASIIMPVRFQHPQAQVFHPIASSPANDLNIRSNKVVP